MAAPSLEVIRESIEEMLKDADLSQLSSKKVRKELEQKFRIDLTEKKKDIDKIL
jgi:phage shock protein A